LSGTPKADAIAVWAQVNEVCNLSEDASKELWRVDPYDVTPSTDYLNAMTAPPWSGVRRARGTGSHKGERCFLLAPVELQ
jgi:hypothetical protein